MKGWVKIYETKDPIEAEILKGMLEDEEEIDCILINKQDSNYLVFGEVELYVRQANALKALHVIKESNEDERPED